MTEKRKKRPLLLAFCIPAAIMTAVIILKEIYPFGSRCFLRVDMYNQYMPFFMELHRKMREGESLLFSWRAGLGANFTALYAYYLASPMNWLLLLCPEPFVIEFMTVLIVIKTGLCGTTFAWYLKKHFRVNGYTVSVFAVFYALSGYLCAYNWNIMWLDCMILAPVIVLGLEQLVYEKKPFLYCISLAASILTNYYISIPICIFLACYYMVLAVSVSGKERLRSFLEFVLYSLLAAGVSGILLLPAAEALQNTGFHEVSFPTRIKFYFHIGEMLARHCMNVATELRSDHWPNLYCGVFVFFMVPLYVCCKNIRWKEKLPRLLLLGFFYLSFSMNVLDFCWHGFNYPNSLPARQSFLAIFLILTLCFEAFLHFGEFSGRQIALSTGGALVFLCLCSQLWTQEDFNEKSYVFTMLYLALDALLLYWYREGSLKKNLSGLLLSSMVIMETAMNVWETSIATTDREEYCSDYETNQRLLADWTEESAERLENSEKEFCRIEEHNRMTKNDGMLAGFPTATYFSSTVNENMSEFYKKLGMSGSKVFYCYDGATPLASALLHVKYVISDQEEPEEFYELRGEENGKYLYESRYVLPLGFGVPSGLNEEWELEEGLPFDVQNQIAAALGIEKRLFEQVPTYEEEKQILIEPAEDGYLYGYPITCSHKDITAKLEEGEKTYEKVYYHRILDFGWCEKGSGIALERSGDIRNEEEGFEVSVYRMNPEVLETMISRLGNTPMKLEQMQDTYVRGSIEMKEAGMLVTSIPNEAGWKAKVDGKQTAITPFGGAMLGVELEKGKHILEFTYTPPGLYGGAAVSGLSSLILILLWQLRRKLNAHEKEHRARRAEP